MKGSANDSMADVLDSDIFSSLDPEASKKRQRPNDQVPESRTPFANKIFGEFLNTPLINRLSSSIMKASNFISGSASASRNDGFFATSSPSKEKFSVTPHLNRNAHFSDFITDTPQKDMFSDFGIGQNTILRRLRSASKPSASVRRNGDRAMDLDSEFFNELNGDGLYDFFKAGGILSPKSAKKRKLLQMTPSKEKIPLSEDNDDRVFEEIADVLVSMSTPARKRQRVQTKKSSASDSTDEESDSELERSNTVKNHTSSSISTLDRSCSELPPQKSFTVGVATTSSSTANTASRQFATPADVFSDCIHPELREIDKGLATPSKQISTFTESPSTVWASSAKKSQESSMARKEHALSPTPAQNSRYLSSLPAMGTFGDHKKRTEKKAKKPECKSKRNKIQFVFADIQTVDPGNNPVFNSRASKKAQYSFMQNKENIPPNGAKTYSKSAKGTGLKVRKENVK